MLKSFLVLFLLLVFSASSHAQTIAANSSNITYIGRWTDTTISSTPARASISGGTRLRFQINETSATNSIVAAFDIVSGTGPYIEYIIDGGTPVRAAVTTSMTWATNLSVGTHTVEMWVSGVDILSDKWDGLAGVRFLGLTVDSTATVTAWPTGLPRMLSIGDSVTEGMLNLYQTYGVNSPISFSGRLSFSNQLAALLGMENWNVAFGGSGFTVELADNVPYTQTSYPYKSNGAAEADPSFSIILIAAGNNDGTGSGYISQYETLLSEVIANNPTAKIFCLGPTYSAVGNFPSAETACAAYGAAYISTSSLSGLVSLPNLGHPNITDDTTIANFLQPIFAPYVPVTTIKVRIKNGFGVRIGKLSTGQSGVQIR